MHVTPSLRGKQATRRPERASPGGEMARQRPTHAPSKASRRDAPRCGEDGKPRGRSLGPGQRDGRRVGSVLENQT